MTYKNNNNFSIIDQKKNQQIIIFICLKIHIFRHGPDLCDFYLVWD